MKKAKAMKEVKETAEKTPAKKAHVRLVKPAEIGSREPGIGCRPLGVQ